MVLLFVDIFLVNQVSRLCEVYDLVNNNRLYTSGVHPAWGPSTFVIFCFCRVCPTGSIVLGSRTVKWFDRCIASRSSTCTSELRPEPLRKTKIYVIRMSQPGLFGLCEYMLQLCMCASMFQLCPSIVRVSLESGCLCHCIYLNTIQDNEN